MSAARVIGTALAAGIVALIMALLRFDPANVALAAVAVAVAGAFLGRQDLASETVLPPLPSEPRGGHRREVSQLAWSLTGPDGRATAEGWRQVRAAARGRLASAGIDPDDDAAVAAALGDRALRTLRAVEPPGAHALDACLTALEHCQGAHR